jgi:DNA-binding LacI/PurR family transcriptional regulator
MMSDSASWIAAVSLCRLELSHAPCQTPLVSGSYLFLSEIVQPALTTLHLSRQEIASRAFYALQARGDHATGAKTTVILPRLVVRASSGGIGSTSKKP